MWPALYMLQVHSQRNYLDGDLVVQAYVKIFSSS